ncbi:hypothetical protein C8Q78DRAFT_287060 [Trametes maxima]|nr:hypothetical protein C8Q78DRAFT_287060 [Trametes maxima]
MSLERGRTGVGGALPLHCAIHVPSRVGGAEADLQSVPRSFRSSRQSLAYEARPPLACGRAVEPKTGRYLQRGGPETACAAASSSAAPSRLMETDAVPLLSNPAVSSCDSLSLQASRAAETRFPRILERRHTMRAPPWRCLALPRPRALARREPDNATCPLHDLCEMPIWGRGRRVWTACVRWMRGRRPCVLGIRVTRMDPDGTLLRASRCRDAA